MQAQQLLDHIIVPTLKYMGRGYDSLDARMLKLATAAPESNCGYWIKQRDNGPALGIWQMEPTTHNDIWRNCDALRKPRFAMHIKKLMIKKSPLNAHQNLIVSPMYACAMARLKYAMDRDALPDHNDKKAIYEYYKRIYNTELGASTWDKFRIAWDRNQLSKVKLS